jgi:hypothetical protein
VIRELEADAPDMIDQPTRSGDRPAPASAETALMCAGLWQMVFGVMAGRAGGHWAITPGEAEQLGKASGALLDKYAPGFAMGPEYAFVAVVATVTLPRYLQHKAITQQAEAGDDGGQ